MWTIPQTSLKLLDRPVKFFEYLRMSSNTFNYIYYAFTSNSTFFEQKLNLSKCIIPIEKLTFEATLRQIQQLNKFL